MINKGLKKSWWVEIGLIGILLGGVAACSDIPPEYKPFFRLSPREMEKAIFDYPLDHQIDLMIIGWTIPHPPFMMWPEVASNGEKSYPYFLLD